MDKDLLAAARDLKFQDPKRFAELATQYPELAAEATKPRITKDGAGTGSPKGYEPYRTWSLGPDRGRWYRTSGASSDIDSGGDDSEHLGAWASAPAELHERSLLDLHLSTDGGYSVTKSGTRSNQLEVCRLCGEPLKLSRDAEGYAYRDRGKQPEYCGPNCRKAVKEARARAKRAAQKPAAAEAPFSLDGVYVAGVGKIELEPAVWNQQQPRSNPRRFEPLVKKVDHLPWLHHNARSRTPQGQGQDVRDDDRYRLAPHRLVQSKQSAGIPRASVSNADRIARRYGTGGTPPAPVLTPGWDRVVTFWRFPKRNQAPTHQLTSVADNVWRIESAHANY